MNRTAPAFSPDCYTIPGALLAPQLRAKRAAAGLPSEGFEFRGTRGNVEVKSDGRNVELWIARYGNIDNGGDVIEQGAAADTIARRGPGGSGLVKFFWDHHLLLGPMVALEESKDGIFAVGRVDDDASLSFALAHARSGAAAHGSIGYKPTKVSRKVIGDQVARKLDTIELYEGSLVVWPMNEAATLQAVKSVLAVGQLVDGATDKPTHRKDLWAAADAIRCLAEIEAAEARLAWLLAEDNEWAKLTGDQRAKVLAVVDGLSSLAEKGAELRRLFGLEDAPPAPTVVVETVPAQPEPPTVDQFKTALSQLVATVEPLIARG